MSERKREQRPDAPGKIAYALVGSGAVVLVAQSVWNYASGEAAIYQPVAVMVLVLLGALVVSAIHVAERATQPTRSVGGGNDGE